MLALVPAAACAIGAIASCASSQGGESQQAPTVMVVEASCGQCMFGMPGNGCDLAVRIDGKTYYVDGTGIDDHGDAHAHDGFCNAIRQARVAGYVDDDADRFIVTSFELLPSED